MDLERDQTEMTSVIAWLGNLSSHLNGGHGPNLALLRFALCAILTAILPRSCVAKDSVDVARPRGLRGLADRAEFGQY